MESHPSFVLSLLKNPWRAQKGWGEKTVILIVEHFKLPEQKKPRTEWLASLLSHKTNSTPLNAFH